MGQEARCTARFSRCYREFGDKVSEGKALLETNALIFRGDFRLSIPLKEVQSVEAVNGQLKVVFPGGEVVFDLGRLAEKWALKIRHPKSLMDKLGIKLGSRVAVLGIKDESFWQMLNERTIDISVDGPAKESDFILMLAESKEDLGKLKLLQAYIKRDGAIWVVASKGKQHIKESDVLAAGREAGLVDVKVASFSQTHTAHQFVIPRASR